MSERLVQMGVAPVPGSVQSTAGSRHPAAVQKPARTFISSVVTNAQVMFEQSASSSQAAYRSGGGGSSPVELEDASVPLEESEELLPVPELPEDEESMVVLPDSVVVVVVVDSASPVGEDVAPTLPPAPVDPRSCGGTQVPAT